MTQSIEPPAPSPGTVRAIRGSQTEVAGSGGPIAVLGMPCRFPGADGFPAFWRLRHDGANAVQVGGPDSGGGRVERSHFGHHAGVVFHDLGSLIGAVRGDGAMTAVSAGGMR